MYEIKNLFRLGIFLCLALFAFTACEKESMDDLSENDVNNTTVNQSYLSLQNSNTSTTSNDDCFEINYPIDIIFPDGTTVSVGSEDELENLIDDWFENNPDADDEPMIDFPITITFPDGETQTIEDEETLCDLYHDCYGDDEDEEGDEDDEDCTDEYEDCFEINYPVTVIMPDGTSMQVNSDDELEDFVDDWYDANEDSDEEVTFDYPVEVTLEDGTIQTLNSDDEVEDLLESCE